MNVNCNERERIFLDGTAEEWAALEEHASNCAACADELRAWKQLTAAATELRDYQQDSASWAKIETKLIENQSGASRFWKRWGLSSELFVGWRVVLAGTMALLLALSGVYLVRHRKVDNGGRLLKNSTLAQVERTERDYMKAIDQLAAETKPQLDSPATPLMASYKEKLLILDSAIDELRMETGRNPSNAHLRHQLLAMYQEKQETLQEVLETKR